MSDTMGLVRQVGDIAFVGNIIPHTWFVHLRKETGKPYLEAIVILSDIIYWYRPRIVRDEATGQVLRIEKRFWADKLQRNYQQIANQFGISKRQAKRAVVFLEEQGVITRELRTVETKGGLVLSNVLFLEPVIERLREITSLVGGVSKFGHSYDQKRTEGVSKIGQTYTETTTKKTTETTERDTHTLPSGRYAGKTLSQVLETDPGYVEWVAHNWKSRNIRDAAARLGGDGWTAAELEVARAEALAEEPLDPAVFFAEG